MVPPLLAAFACLPVVQDGSDAPRDPSFEELSEAWSAFEAAPARKQEEVVRAIAARVEASADSGLRELLALRDCAARELGTILPARPREFHDPRLYAEAEFARGRVRRFPADPGSVEAAEAREKFKPWENELPLARRVIWSLAHDEARESGERVEPLRSLEDFLNGYPPGSDLLVAWLMKRFDFEPSLGAALAHFDHLYCDLNGRIHPDVTLYDAFASGSDMDMPDVDVIAYARRVLKDDSWVSPIPPGPQQQRIYELVGAGFLDCFRYRLWIEAAASLYVRPTAPLRGTHEGLRSRLLQLFATEEGDVDRIAAALARFKTRGNFLGAMDDALAADRSLARKAAAFEEKRAAQHWAVARAAYAALREHELLAR